MNANLADVTLLVDRSSSMRFIRDAAELGVNTFIQSQAEAPGEAVLTLIQFDRRYEVTYLAKPVKEAPPFQLLLGNGTALVDAMGRAINETHARITALAEADRPGLIAFVVVSDGEENSSKEFTKQDVHRAVSAHRRDDHWQFSFLGANQDVAYEAGSLGFDMCSSAPWSTTRVVRAYQAAADNVARMRRQRAAGEPVRNTFTDDERNSMT